MQSGLGLSATEAELTGPCRPQPSGRVGLQRSQTGCDVCLAHLGYIAAPSEEIVHRLGRAELDGTRTVISNLGSQQRKRVGDGHAEVAAPSGPAHRRYRGAAPKAMD